MPKASAKPIILASGSRARRLMLSAAGVDFTVVPATVDESAVRDTLLQGTPDIEASDVAEVLARAKAGQVSEWHTDALVIGADQTLACDGTLYSKPATVSDARDILLKLRGRTHQLHSAVTLAEGGAVTWAVVETAHLTMRNFSLAFLGDYLARAGTDVLESVGAYKLEGLGLQLFERFEGDHFTILGLPLLSLLSELRRQGALMT